MKLRELISELFNGKHGEKLRFLVAGGFNTAVGYGLFALGLWLLTPVFAGIENSYLLIQWIMWVISVPLGAFTLKYFAFRAEGSYWRQALRAYLVYLPAQLVTFALLALFSTVMGLHPLLGQLFALSIAVIISYLGHKYFTFKNVDKKD